MTTTNADSSSASSSATAPEASSTNSTPTNAPQNDSVTLKVPHDSSATTTASETTVTLPKSDLKDIKKPETPAAADADDTTSPATKPQQQQRTSWIAPVKPEYIIPVTKKPDSLKRTADNAQLGSSSASGAKPKKKQRGMNKNRARVNKLGVKKDDSKYIEIGKDELNKIPKDLKRKLQKKKYDYSKADQVEKHVTQYLDAKKKKKERGFRLSYLQPNKDANRDTYVHTKFKPEEIKSVQFEDKLIVAPLTTVGNLPFRRICKEYGADITVSEMAVAPQILKGSNQELALLKRHKSEDVFGLQIAGNSVHQMSRIAQLVTEELEVDFIDINCGCPIDLICNKGMGTGLMAKKTRFEGVVRGMKEILDIPLTIKIRTGLLDRKPIAHSLVPKLVEWGANAITLHGRSKQQRYTREADWDYISQCADVANSVPFIGNGDILSYTEYNDHVKNHNVQAVMIGRGALIKPWVLTEIKEQRHWDISATERFDMLKRFVSYGMDHYGADEYGVEKTRRFLLEWLSFLHRYIPVGLLERGLPQHINERPPNYRGRNELETLMASPNVDDWIEITKRLIPQKIPDGFAFVPKHKANSARD